MSEPDFPMTDAKYGLRIDKTMPTPSRPSKYRVYYWAPRPDAKNRAADDLYHWHPDSEHDKYVEAQARFEELKQGGKARSIFKMPLKT